MKREESVLSRHACRQGDTFDYAACRPATLYAWVGKRILDVVGAAALLVVLSPLVLLTALAVAMVSGRPILFRDRRAGLDGRPFTLWKFRSMREARGPDGTPLPDVARLTPFGRLLRQTSLDELPQLWCVLSGTMSLVGPRPLPLRYVERYSPRQSRRLLVRPGLTGWAQTRGRNTLDWRTRLSLDAEYVDHLGQAGGLLLDLRILAVTVTQVCSQAVTGHGVSAPATPPCTSFSAARLDRITILRWRANRSSDGRCWPPRHEAGCRVVTMP